MSPDDAPGAVPDESVEEARKMEQVCDAFEAAWQAGQRPDIGAAVGAVSPDIRTKVCKELIGLDLFYRGKAGESPQVQDYADRFPDVDPVWLAAAARGDESRSAAPRASEDVGGLVAGRYKLRQRLGEGGMGTVYQAEQIAPLKRMVALKVIKPGMDSKQVLARFEAERQALAMMDHPNIAKVLDAGTTEAGQPFFVMELVRGVPLNQFCDDRKLSVAERLQIFQQVCQAVEHAHQKGIVHRDLKPSNILVESHDGRPVPKIIDFGLAKAITAQTLTERSLFTQFGSVLGTPEYMAPEQAELNALNIDARADVYALGVILYELLTGTTPLERKRLVHAVWDEIRRVIKEEEPPTPSARLSTLETQATVAAQRRTEPAKLGRFVRGDLDWIVMTALAKERDRRYRSAAAFAADVGRFLSDVPVSAGPPSVRYRVRKYFHRNRRRVGVVAIIGLAILIGLAGAMWAINAEHRRQEAAEALRQERIRAALEKGVLAVLSADFTIAEDAAREAEAAGASPGQLQMLRGQVAFCQGKNDAAIQLLEAAAADQPNNVAVRGMLAFVYGYAGDSAKLDQMIAEMDRVDPAALTPVDLLFKGLGESTLDAEKAWPTLQQAFAGRQSPVVRLVHADVRASYLAQVGGSPDDVREALHYVAVVRELLPGKPPALRTSLRIQLIAVGVFQDADLKTEHDRAVLQARNDFDGLKSFVGNPDMAAVRYYLAREVDGDQAALAESTRSFKWVKKPHPLVAMNYAQALYLNGEFEAAAKVMVDYPDFFLGYWVRLFATAELQDGKRQADALAHELLAKDLGGWDAYNRILMLYFLGRPDARERAKAFLGQEQQFPTLRRERFRAAVEFLAGESSPEKLLEGTGGMNRADLCNAHLSIGLRRLADGDRKGAMVQFKHSRATRVIDFVPYDMSYLILSRMTAPGNDAWPPWIQPKVGD
jgi:serine/threonine protein kinase